MHISIISTGKGLAYLAAGILSLFLTAEKVAAQTPKAVSYAVGDMEIIVQRGANAAERSDTIKYISVIAEKDKPVSVDNPKLVARKVFSTAKSEKEITAYNTKDANSEKFDKVVFVMTGYYDSDGSWINDDMSGFITELEVKVNGKNIEPVLARVEAFDSLVEGGVIGKYDPDMLWYILALSKSVNNDNAFPVKDANGANVTLK